MAFRLDTPYYQIPGLKSQATFGTMVEMLLKTRLKLHLETSQELGDEDVNAYLAGLLVSYIDPGYLTHISDWLSHYDLDVYQAVSRSEDRVQAYWIYKVNADDLLVSLGVFHRLWRQEKGELTRMKRYYSYASEYQKRIYGRPTAVGQIQTKLAEWSERYLAILAETRSDYLHLRREIKPEELDVFKERLRQLEQELPLKKALDEFLDVYSAWLKNPDEVASRERLLQKFEALKKLNPHFKIDPKSLPT